MAAYCRSLLPHSLTSWRTLSRTGMKPKQVPTSSEQRQTKQARQKELLASAVEHCAATTDTVRTNAAGWGLCEETPLFHQVFLVQYAGYYLVF
jgi:hypothetical protein